jgi:hypothetical protein
MGKKLALRLAAIPTFLAATAGYALAALPDGAEQKAAEVGTDLKTMGGAILLAMMGFWAVRKLGTKMGWW